MDVEVQLMTYLRWVDYEEVRYTQEPVKRVSERASKVLAILNGILNDSATDEVQCARIVRRLKGVITNEQAAAVIGGELYALHGCKLDKAQRVTLACSVSGAVAAASVGSEGGVLASDVEDVAVWARICHVLETQEDTGERLTRLQLLICNSVLAGQRVTVELRAGSDHRWSRMLGLRGNRRKPLAWHTARQFADACVIAQVRSTQGLLEVIAVTMNTATLAVNAKLSRGRSRRYARCHLGAEHDCGQCGIGRNQCDRSCVFEATAYDLGESKGT